MVECDRSTTIALLKTDAARTHFLRERTPTIREIIGMERVRLDEERHLFAETEKTPEFRMVVFPERGRDNRKVNVALPPVGAHRARPEKNHLQDRNASSAERTTVRARAPENGRV